MSVGTPVGFEVVPIDLELERGRADQHRVEPRDGETALSAERRRRREMQDLRRAPVDGVSVTDEVIGGVACRVLRPLHGPARTPALIWMHGGGWIYGSNDGDDGMLSRFVLEAGISVVSVDYRLAPEHPYPAAVDDAGRVYDALRGDTVEFDCTRIIVGGASAGATIASSLTLRLRDHGIPPLAQFLICPPLDDRVRYDDPLGPFSRDQMDGFWNAYKAGSTDDVVAPGRAESLRGLPRTYVFTTSGDPLRIEGWTYAVALATAGVEVEAQFLPGGYHGFEYEVPDAALSRRAVSDWVSALARIAHTRAGAHTP